MPNIPPLISSMPDSQSLYASYTVTGGGGSTAVVLNNGNRVANVGGTVALIPQTPTAIGTLTVNANYGTDPITLRILGFAETAPFSITTTSTPTAGDQLSFYYVMNGVQLPQTVVVPFASLTGPNTIQLSTFTEIGAGTAGAATYTATLYALYNSTGVNPWQLGVGAKTLTAQAIACVAA